MVGYSRIIVHRLRESMGSSNDHGPTTNGGLFISFFRVHRDPSALLATANLADDADNPGEPSEHLDRAGGPSAQAPTHSDLLAETSSH